MKSSKTYYNNIADTYQNQVNSKIKYLNAVDDFIVSTMKEQSVRNYLDIGTGDGRRAFKLIEAMGIGGDIVLVDDSGNMLSAIANHEKVTVFNDTIFNFKRDAKFQLVTCLWNVLGHLPSKIDRINLFKLVEAHLAPNGVFIFDVNNRYNTSYYGFKSVSNNLKKDHFNEDNAGWFSLGDPPNETQVYIHSPFDIEEYIVSTDLVLEKTLYKDYITGEVRDTFFEGQLIYKLRKLK